MSGLMSPRAMRTIRTTAERWMVDEVEFWSPSSWDNDADDDLEVEHVEGQKLWEGKARVRPTTGPREQAVGDEVLALRDADVNVPLDAPEPFVDMEVKVVSSEDPALVGRWLRVTDVRVFGQQATRKFSAIQFQRSAAWWDQTPPDAPVLAFRTYTPESPEGGSPAVPRWEFSWDEVDDAVAYNFYGTDMEPEPTYTLVTETEDTSLDMPAGSLAHNGYVVTAVDVEGDESDYSNVVTT